MRKRLVAFLASAMVPGLGQLLAGRTGRAVLLAALYYGLDLINTLLAPLWMGFTFRTYAIGWFGIRLLRLVIALDAWRVGQTRGTSRAPVYAGFLAAFVMVPRLVMVWAVEHNAVPMRECVISSESMQPTIRSGETVIVDNRVAAPRLDQLVLVSTPLNQVSISRVLALGDSLVKIDQGRLIRDSKPVAEAFPMTGNQVDTLIPHDRIYLLSDNRNAETTRDSRHYGSVLATSVIAHPLFIFWSPDHSRIGKRLQGIDNK